MHIFNCYLKMQNKLIHNNSLQKIVVVFFRFDFSLKRVLKYWPHESLHRSSFAIVKAKMTEGKR